MFQFSCRWFIFSLWKSYFPNIYWHIINVLPYWYSNKVGLFRDRYRIKTNSLSCSSNITYWCIDDITCISINIGIFLIHIHAPLIYLYELEIKGTTYFDTYSSYLDILLDFYFNGRNVLNGLGLAKICCTTVVQNF
jgi:hypothetical protein